MSRPASRRAGAALLEAMVAMAILGSASLALAATVTEAYRLAKAAERRQRAFDGAEELLRGLTLSSAPQLDRMLGSRRRDGFIVTVGRPRPGLYRLAIAEAGSPTLEVLVTVVRR